MSRNIRKCTSDMCTSKDSDQPAHSNSLIRIITGHILDSKGCKVSSCENEDCAGWFESSMGAHVSMSSLVATQLIMQFVWQGLHNTDTSFWWDKCSKVLTKWHKQTVQPRSGSTLFAIPLSILRNNCVILYFSVFFLIQLRNTVLFSLLSNHILFDEMDRAETIQ